MSIATTAPGSVVLALVVLAVAVLCWPTVRAASRVRRDRVVARSAQRGRAGLLPRMAIPAGVVAGGLVAGIGGGCCAAALGALVRKCWLARRRARDGLQRSAALAAGLRLMVADLRAGAHPATAAEGATGDGAGEVVGIFRDIAATARLGGDVPALLEDGGLADPGLREPMRRLARCWRLADRHGVALADLVEAVRRDLDNRAEFERDVEAKMAGPRSTAAVLSGLPVLGLVLGESVGAGPIGVLTGGVTGQVLLVVGTALICAGVLWTVRLTESAVRT